MPKKVLDNLISQRDEFDQESKVFLDSLVLNREEIDQFNSMKTTAGWKLLDKKIREELQERILELVKNDEVIKTLIALLTVTATKKRSKELEAVIESIIPE